MLENIDWIPITKEELKKKGWDEVDVIIVSGDAYVDHPAFSNALIARLIESKSLRVAILPQPNWQDDLRDFKKLGKPRLFFGVSSGNMDSMVNHYTAAKRLRSNDAYTPGGQSGFRPDYASYVYTNILKTLYPDVPIVLGGIEASMRRFTHYDYWSDKLKPSILAESKADLLIYGMGEKPLLELIGRLKAGESFSNITDIKQTAYITNNKIVFAESDNNLVIPSHESCLKDKKVFAKMFRQIEEESNCQSDRVIIQKIGNANIVVNAPFHNITEKEIDTYYSLPYKRLPHPKYIKRGNIPAFEMIKNSINIHRGCFGGCSFCTISMHQGKQITNRSEQSILKEIEIVTKHINFKGYLSDIGGPSANMYGMGGIDKSKCKECKRSSCIFPGICKNLNIDHSKLINLYKKINSIKGIKKAFIGSGVRYDMLLSDDKEIIRKNQLDKYTELLILDHVSGRLKVAPEHTERHILDLIRKPDFEKFIEFKTIFDNINKKYNLRQEIVPYIVSSLPDCKLEDMKTCSKKLQRLRIYPEQVQDFTPTPMTLSSVLYYSNYNPYTEKTVFVEKNIVNKKKQKETLF
ncbi:MAG: YgiQ family radical SAM protein [Bacteroidetes bacterium GWF2_29_10]|nr:MAG: YgiQ family radical SAM protein [Bacteroidetes bacterium GWF2_29_10]